jgi:hypothetical protein
VPLKKTMNRRIDANTTAAPPEHRRRHPPQSGLTRRTNGLGAHAVSWGGTLSPARPDDEESVGDRFYRALEDVAIKDDDSTRERGQHSSEWKFASHIEAWAFYA